MDVLRAVSGRSSPPDNLLIQQETAPAVLATILHRIRVGKSDDIVDALNRLIPSDMVQTEHIIIVGAAKYLVENGQRLDLNALTNEIAKNDPADFVKLVLDGLLESSIPDDCPLENAVDELVGSRAICIKDRLKAGAIAKDLLRGRTRLCDSASELAAIGAFCRDNDRRLFSTFESFLSEIRDFPLGDQRRHWNQDALARKDAELLAIEKRTMVESRENLEAIAEWAPEKKWWQFWK